MNRRCLDDVITTVLTSEDTLLAKRRVVVLTGPAGAGKSVCVNKLAQDWARGQVLKGYELVLHLCVSECVTTWVSKVRESGSVSEKEERKQSCLSLENLLMLAHPHLSSTTVSYVLKEPSSPTQPRLLLLLDGLDEIPHLPDISELLLSPSSLPLCSDPRRPVPISHLLSSLAQGTLLPAASLLITSRKVPDMDALPPGVKRVEVLGFSTSQRSQFFQRFLGEDGDLAPKMTQLCESVFGVYEFSSLPLFCWTLASVGRTLQQTGGAPPEAAVGSHHSPQPETQCQPRRCNSGAPPPHPAAWVSPVGTYHLHGWPRLLLSRGTAVSWSGAIPFLSTAACLSARGHRCPRSPHFLLPVSNDAGVPCGCQLVP